MEVIAGLLYCLFMVFSIFVPEGKSEPYVCKGDIVQTHMGEICVNSKDPERVKDLYMTSYIHYLEKKFDSKVVPYSGKKYSIQKLYCIYRYVLHKDGSIHDLKLEVSQNEQFDNLVKKLILDNPPIAFLENMPDTVKVELAVLQTTGVGGVSIIGNTWHDYYVIILEKNSEFDE